MTDYRELLIGCGARHDKQIAPSPERANWSSLTTLDINPDHKPDIVHDLCELPLPFPSNHFDEIHAYEVLEHTGQQGDWRFFFRQFLEFWRILRPDGLLLGTSPVWNGPWAWGDPGHTRLIQSETFVFLSQLEYTKQVGVTPMSDYRFVYRGDFNVVHQVAREVQWEFGLQAVKPSRISI